MSSRLTAAGRMAFAVLWLFVCSFPVEKSFELPGLGNISKVLGVLALGGKVVADDADPQRRRLGRERFKSYRDQKLTIETHQLSAAADI